MSMREGWVESEVGAATERTRRRHEAGSLDLAKHGHLLDHLVAAYGAWREEGFSGRSRRHLLECLALVLENGGRGPPSFRAGDHLKTQRSTFLDRVDCAHHGIYLGHGLVVHYHGTRRDRASARVTITALEEFADDHPIHVVYSPARQGRSTEQVNAVLRRALGRLSERAYDAYYNDCEDFALGCISGECARGRPQRRRPGRARPLADGEVGPVARATVVPTSAPFTVLTERFATD